MLTGPITEGPDVSSVQGKPDWQTVAATGRYGFGIAKALEGNADYPDPTFAHNWKGIGDAGLIRGAYAFLHPDTVHGGSGEADAIDEAKRFVARVGPLGSHDFLAGDLEDAATVAHGLPNGEPFVRWLVTWGETVEAESGKTPFDYTGGPFWQSHAGLTKTISPELLARVRRFPAWLAAYVPDPARYIAMTPWERWVFWQRSGNFGAGGAPGARVPGIDTVVDMNAFVGSVADLRAIIASLHFRQTAPDGGLQLGDSRPVTSIADEVHRLTGTMPTRPETPQAVAAADLVWSEPPKGGSS